MNVRIAQVLSFTAGSWYNGSLEMNPYTVKLWMITQTYDSDEQNIAFQRMKHFIYGELDSTIFINSEEQEKCAELIRAGFNITTMPGEPADQLIGIMLFHKLNSIMEGRIGVVEVELRAGEEVIYLHGENETSEVLPQPSWWATADLVHSDIVNHTENIVSMRPVNSWRDLDLAWTSTNQTTENGNTIVFADFKSSDDTK